jgi:hypothetical protein
VLVVSIGALLGGAALVRWRTPVHVGPSKPVTPASPPSVPVNASALAPPPFSNPSGFAPEAVTMSTLVSAPLHTEALGSASVQRAARKSKPAPAASVEPSAATAASVAPSAAPPLLPPYNLE